jgi:Chaperone of endosialidase
MKKVLPLLALWPVFALGQAGTTLYSPTLYSPVYFRGSSLTADPMLFIGSSVDPNAANFGIGIKVYPGGNYGSTRADTVMSVGYNISATGNPAEASVGLVVEDYYIPGGDSIAQTELHLMSTDINGVAHRFFDAFEKIDGSTGRVSIQADAITFQNNSSQGDYIQFNLGPASGNLALNNTYLLFNQNNYPTAVQRNAAGNAFLNLPFINSSNQLAISEDIYLAHTLYANAVSAIALTASGTITFSGLRTGTNTDFVCMSPGGVLTIQTSACTISSLRFKENVEDMEGSAEPSIDKMRVASFQMKDTNNQDPNARSKQIGLIAENIAQVAPECAIYEDDMKTPKSYRQECVIALLVKAMQEQAKEIAELKARH